MEIHNPAAGSSKKRKKQSGKKKVTAKIVDQMDVSLEVPKKGDDGEIANINLELNLHDTVSNVQLLMGNLAVDRGTTEDSSKRKKKKRRKKIKKTQIIDEVQSMDRERSIQNIQLPDEKLRQEIDEGVVEGQDVQSTNQNKMDIKSTVSIAEGHMNAKRKRKRKKAKNKTENNDKIGSRDQSISLSYMQLSDKSLRKEIGDKLTKNADARNTNLGMMDVESTVTITEGNVKAKRNKRKKIKDKSIRQEIGDKLVKNADAENTNLGMMDVESTVNITAGNTKAKRRMRQKIKVKVEKKDEVRSMDQLDSMSKLQLSDENFRQEICDKLVENEDDKDTNESKMDIESTVNLAEGDTNAKRKLNKRKIKKKKGNKDEPQSMNQSNSTSHLQSDENLSQEIDDKHIENKDDQSTDQSVMDIKSTCNPAVDIVDGKRKRKKKKQKAKSKVKNEDELQSINQANDFLNLKLSENKIGQEIDSKLIESDCIAEESDIFARKEYKTCQSDHKMSGPTCLSNSVHNMENHFDLRQEEDAVLAEVVRASTNSASELQAEKSGTLARPMWLGGEGFPCENQLKTAPDKMAMGDTKFENVLNKVKNEIIVVEGTTSFDLSDVREAECLSNDLGESPSIPTTTRRRKLLVLDVNGLLAYIVMPAPKDHTADIHILGRAVFKRPFCDDFLRFCFQNFDVGIWSSRAKKVIEKVVDYLLGNLKQKLLFCWDMSHSTQTGFKTLENKYKPLVCKELRKIWENNGSESPWRKGDYDESNTLLLDDSPYKALLNPPHTAIFPHSYHCGDKDDSSLGPGGDLRVYLEGLLESENVREYVEGHPFGQSAISETNVSWQFYSGVLQKMSNEIEALPTPVITSSLSIAPQPQDKLLDIGHEGIARSTALPVRH